MCYSSSRDSQLNLETGQKLSQQKQRSRADPGVSNWPLLIAYLLLFRVYFSTIIYCLPERHRESPAAGSWLCSLFCAEKLRALDSISSLWRRAASVAVDSYQSLLLTPVVVVVVVVAHCT